MRQLVKYVVALVLVIFAAWGGMAIGRAIGNHLAVHDSKVHDLVTALDSDALLARIQYFTAVGRTLGHVLVAVFVVGGYFVATRLKSIGALFDI